MQSGGYEFSAAPRSVAIKRSKASSTNNGTANGNSERAQNLMFDKRVYRGSAYVMREETPETPGQGAGPRKVNKAAARAARNQQQQQQQLQQQRPPTPPPVGGRFHMDVQTDNYLEELTDRNPEVDADTQTDALLDLHPPVSFVPTPSGVEAATQIDGGDLFDFDLEVEPILEVLVGKTLELGMLELLEEIELHEIRQRQELFEQARNAELAEVQRLEAEAKRRFAEKQRRLDEETTRLAAQAELEEKVAARASAKQYLASLHAQVFDTLVESGHFFDPLAKDIKQHFLPEMLESAAARANQLGASRRLLDTILADALQSRAASG
ncbi:Radial spoke head protein 3 [Phytophthora boehmeriae]|uniref:Radial spoke head protein 3 n=1 Tax=Phytophthora boehmeriae TaxID=109152 RepID=A0A8T1WLV9_9STRA|nr:Radial spoke head protein 3 [Phytophthora boehmeriae]